MIGFVIGPQIPSDRLRPHSVESLELVAYFGSRDAGRLLEEGSGPAQGPAGLANHPCGIVGGPGQPVGPENE